MATSHTPPSDILLEPWEWYAAGWRRLPPLPRQDPAPFDREGCLRRLNRVRGSSYRRNWAPAGIGPHLDPEEGRFWLEVFARRKQPASLVEELRQTAPLGRLGRAGCAALLDKAMGAPAEVVPALASQVDLQTLLALLLEHIRVAVSATYPRPSAPLAAGFRRYVRPWLSEAEADLTRGVLREHARKYAEAPSGKGLPLATVCLMASLGMTGEILPRVSFLSQTRGAGREEEDSLRLFILLGLEDSASIPGEMERRGVSPRGPKEFRGLIAALEEKAIPYLLKSALGASNKADAEALTAPLTLILRPEAAPALLILSHKSKGAALAQRWLDQHPELAVPGLLPLLGEQEHAEAALNYLRQQVRAGRQVLVEQHLQGADPAIVERARRGLDTTTAARSAEEAVGIPGWFPPPPRKQPRLPAWLDPATLPPLRLEGKRLADPAVNILITLLREGDLGEPPVLFGQIKEQAEPRALDAFAWAVFERWLSASGDAKDWWALRTLGLLGGDGVCLPLSRLIVEWARQSLHARASLGLQCLHAINSRLSLLCLRRLGVLHTNAMGLEADELFQEAARSNKVSVAEMEDRCVPDLGLGAEGYRQLDCCGTAYRLTIGADHQARLVDSRHQYLDEWPVLEEGQDPTAVEEARGEWALFRDQVREVVQMQDSRLERDLLGWRRWSVADFQTFILQNRLMRHLARSLLWGAFSSLSGLRQAFRVTEGGSCVDAAGVAVPLAAGDSVGLVHPVLLFREERLVWSDVLAEQGLALPAWQMPRPVWPLREEEKNERQLSRWLDSQMKLGTFADLSRKRKYESGAFQRGHRCCRVRYYAVPNVTAYLLHTPVAEDDYRYESRDISILGAQFRQGNTTGRTPNLEQALPLGSVDPVLLDEVIGLLEEIGHATAGPA